MPATGANAGDEQELVSYELAFHILPTVAEGEVMGVFDVLKNKLTKQGGHAFAEEAPKRFDLAYEIVKHLEGKNRKFGSAYFGWVRFHAESGSLPALEEELRETKELLRFMLIKLTKAEEQNPFRFHDSIVSKKVRVIEEDASGAEAEEKEKEAGEEGDASEPEEATADNGSSAE